MKTMSLMELIKRYPFSTLIICLLLMLFSINQIINLAKPRPPSPSKLDSAYIANYMTVSTMAYQPNLNYQNFVGELSAKFPNQPELASKFNVTSDIEKLPLSKQGNAIRLSILESKIEYLERELNRIYETQQEPLILKLAFYLWGTLVWIASIIIRRILEQFTDYKLNNQYFSESKNTNDK